MSYETKILPLSDITLDSDTQPRVGPNKQALEYFQDLLLVSDVRFPPVVLFYDGNKYYLADGWHRYEAHRRAFEEEISCHIYQGSKRDAILYSVGANGTHGLNMTNADKRRAVSKLLEDPEWSKWGDREIARRCHVSASFVGSIKKSLYSVDSDIPQERTYTNKHGSVSTMKTEGIGKRSSESLTAQIEQLDTAAQFIDTDIETIESLYQRLEALVIELELKDQMISDLEAQVAKLKGQTGVGDEETLPF
jgi:hypothetical protein